VGEGGGEEGECEGEVTREQQRLRHWGRSRGSRGGGAEDAEDLARGAGEGGEEEVGEKCGGAAGRRSEDGAVNRSPRRTAAEHRGCRWFSGDEILCSWVTDMCPHRCGAHMSATQPQGLNCRGSSSGFRVPEWSRVFSPRNHTRTQRELAN
jgi:hypothetical protein